MVAVSALVAFTDAMELAELCIETAQGLKQSLQDAKLGGPAGVAAASSSLAMAKSLCSLSKTATDVLTKAKSQWMLTAGMPPPPGYGVSSAGSRPGSRIGWIGGSPGGGSTPGSGGGTGGGNGARKKSKAVTGRQVGHPTMGSLASPAPPRAAIVRATSVPTDPAAMEDADADPSALADMDDLLPRHDLPRAPTPLSSSKKKGEKTNHQDSEASAAGAAEATPWERQMARFNARQAQLKEHERKARRAARKAFTEQRGVRLHRCAYSYATVGLCKLNSVDPCSLKGAWFQPL
jgi:hypothetical protein